jgi:hypothetical protein
LEPEERAHAVFIDTSRTPPLSELLVSVEAALGGVSDAPTALLPGRCS